MIGDVQDFLAEGPLKKEALTMIVGAVVVISAAIAIMLSEKCYRKTLLVTSAMGISASLFGLGMYFYLEKQGIADGLSWMPIVTFVSYICFFMVRTFHN